MQKFTRYLSSALVLFTLTAPVLAEDHSAHHGASPQGDHHAEHHAAMMKLKAKAVMMPTKDQSATGWLLFENKDGKMHVWGEFSGLTPGNHGIHIHQYGDCSAADGSSAGGHFAALSTQVHAGPNDANHHTGDMGNLIADAQGKAKFDATFEAMGFMGPMSILGRGLIVHEKTDDFKTQPAGDAGKRIACGVIGVTQN